MTPSDALVHVDALDHQPQPTAPGPAERRGLLVALIAAAALHLIIPAAFLIYDLFAPQPAPPLEEIPVELVQEEPPPPKPEPKKEQPPPPPAPDDERPAYDAPSAATQEKANRESKEDKSQAPKTEADPNQQAGAPPDSQREQAAPKQTANAPPPTEAAPAPDADQAAAPTPAPSDSQAAPPAPKVADTPAPPPAPKAKGPPGVPIPEPMEMPEPRFAHAATESPVTGGDADTRYFTIVYGMILQHLRKPPPSAPRPTRSGAVVFLLDEGGNVVQRRLVASSGSPSLDLAVMAAIAQGGPYPAPPGWQPKALRLTYGK